MLRNKHDLKSYGRIVRRNEFRRLPSNHNVQQQYVYTTTTIQTFARTQPNCNIFASVSPQYTINNNNNNNNNQRLAVPNFHRSLFHEDNRRTSWNSRKNDAIVTLLNARYVSSKSDDDGKDKKDDDDDDDNDEDDDDDDDEDDGEEDFDDEDENDDTDFSDSDDEGSDGDDDGSEFSDIDDDARGGGNDSDSSDFSSDDDDDEYGGGDGGSGGGGSAKKGPTQKLASVKEKAKKAISMPLNMTRREFEDAYHLNRALSKKSYTPEEKRAWERMIKPKAWNLRPFEIHPSPPYELDALQNIHNRSFDCNVLLEIRDVRVPASSHHPSFTRLGKHRLHLICYTHADMIDSATRDRVEDWTARSWPGSRSIFVDTREHRPDLTYDLLYDSLLGYLETRGGINSALTVGVPNTGKSCVLMALLRTARHRGDVSKKLKATVSYKKKRRLGKAEPIGILDKPGKTRVITEYLLREAPRAFFLDVPGITPPTFYFEERPEAWFAYGAANLLPQSRTMIDNIQVQTAYCDYVLHCLNRDSQFHYIPKLGLSGPTDDIEEVLNAVKRGKNNKNEERLQLARCEAFLKLFNTGNLGPVILDDISRPYRKFEFKDVHFVKQKQRFDTMRAERQERKMERRGGGYGDGDDYGDDGDDRQRGGRGGGGRGGGGGGGRGGGRGGRGGRGGGRGDGGGGPAKPLDAFDADDFQF